MSFRFLRNKNKTDIAKNTPKLVFQYTTWSALFNGIIRSNEEDDKKVHIFSTNCRYLNDPKEVETGEQYVDMALNGFFGKSGECDDLRHRNAIFLKSSKSKPMLTPFPFLPYIFHIGKLFSFSENEVIKMEMG